MQSSVGGYNRAQIKEDAQAVARSSRLLPEVRGLII